MRTVTTTIDPRPHSWHEGVGVIEAVGPQVSGDTVAIVARVMTLTDGAGVDVAITRLVDTAAIPMLLKVVRSGKLQPAKLITHRFALNDIMKAYDTFGNAAQERALKVILTKPA